VIGTTIGRFLLLDRIGVGGVADVFLARDPRGRRLVVKRLLEARAADGAYRERLRMEGRLGLLCDHDNLVHTLEVGEADGLPYVAVELLPGRTLEEVLACAGRPAPAVAVQLVLQLLEALLHLHACCEADGQPLGLVHRDVCPANVMVAPDGRLRLFDLGVAVATSAPGSYDPGLVAGRPAYASPEAVRGRPLDGRADVWSAGVMLHELLTGERLFVRDDPVRTLAAVAGAPIPAPSEVREELDVRLDGRVLRALCREPVERYANAAAFSAGLSAWARDAGVELTDAGVVGWLRLIRADTDPAPPVVPPRP